MSAHVENCSPLNGAILLLLLLLLLVLVVVVVMLLQHFCIVFLYNSLYVQHILQEIISHKQYVATGVENILHIHNVDILLVNFCFST